MAGAVAMLAAVSWLVPLPDAEQQRAIDRWAIEDLGMDDLMERAGAGLAEVAGRVAPTGRIVVVCGKGNNGGDGKVAARVLRDGWREVDVLEEPFDDLSRAGRRRA